MTPTVAMISHYRGVSPFTDREDNIRFARDVLRVMARCGVAGVAPHVLYHGVLDDDSPEDRAAGLLTSQSIMAKCDAAFVFHPLSEGMAGEVQLLEALGVPLFHLDRRTNAECLFGNVSRLCSSSVVGEVKP